MSGGHYDHSYFQVSSLADDIESEFIRDGKYMAEDWNIPYSPYTERPLIEKDRIGDASKEQRPIILAEIKSLIKDLKDCANRAKELEWYMSGDTGASEYLERLHYGKEID